MNRLFLFLLAVIISMSAIFVSQTTAAFTEEKIYASLEEQMALMRRGQLDALVSGIRGDLLLGNLRGARTSLEQSKGDAFTAFRILHDGNVAEISSEFSPVLENSHFIPIPETRSA